MDRVIVWRVTQSCNMKCGFCSYSAEVDRERFAADCAKAAGLCDILGEYRRMTGEKMLVNWIGGEPFLWEGIIPLSEKLHSYGIGVGAETNGLPLGKKDLRKAVIKSFSEINFGLDGFDDCNDAVRRHFGHFDSVSKNIKALAEMRDDCMSDLKIKVNTVLMRGNIARFEEFCEYLLWLGVDEVTFSRLGCFDRPDFFEANCVTEQQAEAFRNRLPLIQKIFAERRLVIRGQGKYLDKMFKLPRNGNAPADECGKGFWFIGENGFIAPCSNTLKDYGFDSEKITCAEDLARVEEHFGKCRSEHRSEQCDNCIVDDNSYMN